MKSDTCEGMSEGKMKRIACLGLPTSKLLKRLKSLVMLCTGRIWADDLDIVEVDVTQ